MKRILSLLLILPVLLLAACATPPGAAQRTGLLIEPADADALGYTINWASNLQVPSSRQLAAIVVLDDLIVAVEEPSNAVIAVSMRDGEVLWRQVVGEPSEPLFEPVRSGDQILVNSGTQMFHLDADTGRLRNVAPLAHVASTGPVLIEGLAIYGSVNGRIVAHDIVTGLPRWAYQLTGQITSRPIDVGLNVFAADANGVYVLLSAVDRSLLWRGRTFGPVTAAAATDRLSVMVPSHDQSLYALARATGRDRWVYRTTRPLTMTPKPLGLLVYLPVPGLGLVAIDSVDGTEAWRHDEPALAVTLRNDDVLLATRDSLKLTDTQTGNVLEERPTRRLVTVLEGPEESIVLVSPTGRLLRLNPSR